MEDCGHGVIRQPTALQLSVRVDVVASQDAGIRSEQCEYSQLRSPLLSKVGLPALDMHGPPFPGAQKRPDPGIFRQPLRPVGTPSRTGRVMIGSVLNTSLYGRVKPTAKFLREFLTAE